MNTRRSLAAAMTAVAAITFCAALLAINARATYGAHTTADEPQYLMTALSLGEDFNLDISDEIDEERYRSFHEVDLNPQTIDLNASGQRLSPHDPLLPALLAGPMRVGGWALAKATMAAIAALTAAATLWIAVRRFSVSVRVATLVVAAFFVSPPLTSYATQVYPEMPAAFCVIVAIAAITGPLNRRGQVVAIAAAIALPWLAIKYAPVAAVLFTALLVRLWPQQRRAALLHLAAISIAGAFYLVAHQRIYGGWTVYASGDHFVDGEIQVIGENPNYVGRSRRLIGLLVDKRFGLAAWTPSFLLLPAAMVAAARFRTRSTILLITTIGVGWAVATWVALTMHGWWWPGRQLVVILPASVVLIAIVAERCRRLVTPVVFGALIGFGNWTWLVWEASTGRHTLIVDFDQTSNPAYQAWTRLLPDHRNFDNHALALTLVWAAFFAVTALALWSRRRPPISEDQAAAADSTR